MIALLAVLVAATPPSPAAKAEAPAMTREEWAPYAEKEEDALEGLARSKDARGAWRRLQALYRRCPACCEGSASESFGWIAATLLARHPGLITELAPLAAADPEWLKFVLERLHGPIEPKTLRQAARNTGTCPSANRHLCDQIRRATEEAAAEVEAVDPGAATRTR